MVSEAFWNRDKSGSAEKNYQGWWWSDLKKLGTQLITVAAAAENSSWAMDWGLEKSEDGFWGPWLFPVVMKLNEPYFSPLLSTLPSWARSRERTRISKTLSILIKERLNTAYRNCLNWIGYFVYFISIFLPTSGCGLVCYGLNTKATICVRLWMVMYQSESGRSGFSDKQPSHISGSKQCKFVSYSSYINNSLPKTLLWDFTLQSRWQRNFCLEAFCGKACSIS